MEKIQIENNISIIIDISRSMSPWLVEPSEVDQITNLIRKTFSGYHGFAEFTLDFSDMDDKSSEAYKKSETILEFLNDKYIARDKPNLIFVFTDFVGDTHYHNHMKDFFYKLAEYNHITFISCIPQIMNAGTAARFMQKVYVDSTAAIASKDLKMVKFCGHVPSDEIKEVTNKINSEPIFLFTYLDYFLDPGEDSIYSPDQIFNRYGKDFDFSSEENKDNIYLAININVDQENFQYFEEHVHKKEKNLQDRALGSFFSSLSPKSRKLAYWLIIEATKDISLNKLNDKSTHLEFNLKTIKRDIFDDLQKTTLDKKYKYTLETLDILAIFLSGLVKYRSDGDIFVFDNSIVKFLLTDYRFNQDAQLHALESDLFDKLHHWKDGIKRPYKGREQWLKVRVELLAIESQLLAELKELSTTRKITLEDEANLMKKYIALDKVNNPQYYKQLEDKLDDDLDDEN